MVNRPLVSALMPAYNVQSYIGDALRSIASQTYDKFEVVVVDDGSTDKTEEVVRPFLADPRFKYIRQENAGPSAARNNAFRHSTGDLIAFLDADDIWMPEKLEKQIAAFTQDRSLDISATNYSYIAEDGTELGVMQYTQPPQRLYENPKAVFFEKSPIWTTTIMMRREIFDRSGGFDETMVWGEDYDLWLRIIQGGGKLDFIMDPLSKARQRPGSLMTNVLKGYYGKLTVFEKALARENTASGRSVLKRSIRLSKKDIHAITAFNYLPDRPLQASAELLMGWMYGPRHIRRLAWGLALLVPSYLGGRKIRPGVFEQMKSKLPLSRAEPKTIKQ